MQMYEAGLSLSDDLSRIDYLQSALNQEMKNDLITMPFVAVYQALLSQLYDLGARIDYAGEDGKKEAHRGQPTREGSGGQSATSTGAPKRSNSKSKRLSDEERASLMKDGRCFRCKQVGHVSTSCPEAKSVSVKTAEVLTTSPAPEELEKSSSCAKSHTGARID